MKTTLLALACCLVSLLQAQTYTYGVQTPIPDGTNVTGGCGSNTSPGVLSSTINVPLGVTIGDPTKVTFTLNLTHPWLGDIVAEIILPGQTSGCALIKRVNAQSNTLCGSQGNFVAGNILSFNSTFTTPIPSANADVPTGNYAPTGPAIGDYPSNLSLCNLNTFLNNVPVNGNWTLKLYDNGAGDPGSLNAWTINFDTDALGGQEFTFGNVISVLGNPFKNELLVTINKPGAQSAQLSLFTIDGKRVSEMQLPGINPAENIHIDTAALSPGLYILGAEVDGRMQNGIKVVKQ